MYISASFLIIGLATVVFGVLFIVRKRARVFYGRFAEGNSAIVIGIIMVLIGLAVMYFGHYVLPELIDWESLKQEIPELI